MRRSLPKWRRSQAITMGDFPVWRNAAYFRPTPSALPVNSQPNEYRAAATTKTRPSSAADLGYGSKIRPQGEVFLSGRAGGFLTGSQPVRKKAERRSAARQLYLFKCASQRLNFGRYIAFFLRLGPSRLRQRPRIIKKPVSSATRSPIGGISGAWQARLPARFT